MGLAALLLPLAVWSHSSELFFTLTRTGGYLADAAPANTKIIRASEIERTPARTLGDVLEQEAGVVVRESGWIGSSQLPSIRGFSSKQLLLVVDDVPQTPDLTGATDLSRWPVENIERIEIVRGGASAVYGPNAEGGVIHVFTRRPVTALDAAYSAEAGSYGTYSNRLRVGLSSGTLRGHVAGSRVLTEGFQENGDSRNTFLGGMVGWGPVTYAVQGAKGTLGLPSGTPVPIGEWDGERERRANDLLSRQNERDLSQRVEVRAGPLTARLGSNVIDRDVFQFGATTLLRTEGRTALLKAEKGGWGAAGYEYYQRRLDSNVYGSRRGDAWGAFAETFPLPGVTAGLRYDRDNQYGESWSPRLLAVLRPWEQIKASLGVNRSFQAPTLADLYDPFVPERFRAPRLNPEVSWSYEASVAVEPRPGASLSVSLHRADIRDRIALDADRGFAAYNLERAFTQGVDVEAGLSAGPVRQSAGWSYVDARGKAPGAGYRALAFVPRHTLVWRADARGPGKLRVSANARYVHEQWTGIGETGVKIPGYVTVGLKAVRRVALAELFVAVENLLDRHYAQTADSFNGYFPMPGRTLSGGVTLRFAR